MAVLARPRSRFELANRAYLAACWKPRHPGHAMRKALPEIAGQGFADCSTGVYHTWRPYLGQRACVSCCKAGQGAHLERTLLDFIYQPILGPDGAVSGIFVQGHDVTEQKRAEDGDARERNRFRLLAESAPVMLWMGDEQGRCLYLNQPQREFWGVAEDALASFDWNATLHPDDAGSCWSPSEGWANQAPFSVRHATAPADGGHARLAHAGAAPLRPQRRLSRHDRGERRRHRRTRAAEAALRQESGDAGDPQPRRRGARRRARPRTAVQMVTDAGVELTGAEFGAFFYNVLDDGGRALHALHALGRAARGFREFPDAARHRGLRADLPRRGRRALRRHHHGSALRPERAAITACRRATCRCAAISPCRSCRAPARCWAACSSATPKPGVFTERSERSHRRPRRPGGDRDRQCAPVPGVRARAGAARDGGGGAAGAQRDLEEQVARARPRSCSASRGSACARRRRWRPSASSPAASRTTSTTC